MLKHYYFYSNNLKHREKNASCKQMKLCVTVHMVMFSVRLHLFSTFGRSLHCQHFVTVRSKTVPVNNQLQDGNSKYASCFFVFFIWVCLQVFYSLHIISTDASHYTVQSKYSVFLLMKRGTLGLLGLWLIDWTNGYWNHCGLRHMVEQPYN